MEARHQLTATPSEQSRSPIPGRAGLGAGFIFLPWHLQVGWREDGFWAALWAGECGGGCACFPSAFQPQGWAFGEDSGNFRIPWTLQWKVPKPSARPGLLSSACRPSPAFKALETTRTTARGRTVVIFVDCLISGSSKELPISTNNPHVMNTSSSASLPEFILTLA